MGKRGKPGGAGHPGKRPHGQRPAFNANAQVAAGNRQPPAGEASPAAQANGAKPAGQPHARKPRPWKQRADKQGANGSGGKPFRKPAKPQGGHQPARPPRGRRDFDEVQPQSNANASPFGHKTLTVPGGVPQGYGNTKGPRQRSGPRAKRAAQANGRSARQLTGGGSERMELGVPEYSAPKRPSRQPQIRSKRTRTVVQADMAADAQDNPALRRLLLDDKS
jgi:hypothetical protein